jgi:hypothetical protein
MNQILISYSCSQISELPHIQMICSLSLCYAKLKSNCDKKHLLVLDNCEYVYQYRLYYANKLISTCSAILKL